jgi:3-(3-hydroxy-phenyl)propionate hydroxylase
MTDKYVPVVIVGAGPTGLAAANLLGQYGIETLLIERNTALIGLPRAITIDDEGLRICQALGLGDEVLKHVLLDVGAQYFSDGQLIMRLEPGVGRNGYPLISTFSQPHLEATLLAGLRRFANVTVLFGHTLQDSIQTEQEVLLGVRGPTGATRHISCSYLLACDGSKSLIRSNLRIQMKGASYPQRWLVVDGFVGKESGPGRFVNCYYDSTRPVVSIPAPDQHWRWEFMLRPEEQDAAFGQVEGSVAPDWLRRMLLQIGDERVPRIVRQSIYTFHAAYATSFAHKRIFLLGDAAHLLPPFGGQGMNSGLRDAYNLAWKIAFVLLGKAHPRILATYEQERMPHVLQTIAFATFLGKHLVMPTSRVRAFVRDASLRALMKLLPLISRVKEMRMKPESLYRDGLLWKNKTDTYRLAGRLFPQPTVLLPCKRSVLMDELLGPGFALVRLHSDPTKAFGPLQTNIWQKLNVRRICLVPAIQNLQHENNHGNKYLDNNVACAFDEQHRIRRFLRSERDAFVLVRPDRHVLGTFRMDQEPAFATALRELLIGVEERSAVNAG